ncbi:MAG: hypothetical protein AAF334_02470, partial [Pseudomonadota bacterium]
MSPDRSTIEKDRSEPLEADPAKRGDKSSPANSNGRRGLLGWLGLRKQTPPDTADPEEIASDPNAL